MGLGRLKEGSGFEAAKWLISQGAQLVITDLKSESDLEESVDSIMEWFRSYKANHPQALLYEPLFALGKHRPDDFIGAACVVQTPGVPSERELVETAKRVGVAIESDVSLFFRYFKGPIVAVTGTKGKTTTTYLLHQMLKAKDSRAIVAGNVKASPLAFLDAATQEKTPPPVVLELSSWLLESLPAAFSDLKRGPEIAVLTNIFPDHLERYADFDAYIASKEIIFASQTPNQRTILNYDSDKVRSLAKKVKAQLSWFSALGKVDDGCGIENGTVNIYSSGKIIPILPVAEVALKGEHNLSNALAAVCAAYYSGVPVELIANTLKTFSGINDRQEIVREVDEVTYINDTAATTPEATIAALNRFAASRPLILIAGGLSNGTDYQDLYRALSSGVKELILLPGTASEKWSVELLGKVPIDEVRTMAEAVKRAKRSAQAGDIVLLSPGAIGSNVFSNEFDRGEQFREAVRTL